MKFGRKKEEFNYFNEFIENAQFAKEIVKKIKEFIEEFKTSDIEKKAKEIHEIENKADNNLHELKNYLLKDFLPPIDREDILNIAHKVDDIIDGIDEIVIDINIYNVVEIEEQMKKMLELLVQIVNKVHELLVEFKTMKNIELIQAKAIEVNNLEEQGDRMYETAIKELFTTEQHPDDIIKWTNIYQALETCFDACENVADCIEEVLMKNC